MTAAELHTLVQYVASTYALDTNLLMGQVQAESGGDPFAFRYEHDYYERYIVNNSQARAASFGPLAACSYGLLQIMLETAMEIGFTDRPERLFVPSVGLAFGAKYMQKLLGNAGNDYKKALAAYNEGWGSARNGPPYQDQGYIDRVYTLAGLTT